MTKMDLALWCYTTLMALMPEGRSPSYIDSYSATVRSRVPICVDVGLEADRQGLDPIYAIAVGSYESRFKRSAKSSKGAVGVMQMTPVALKTWCSAYSIKTGKPSVLPSQFATKGEIKRCNHVQASVRYLKWLSEEEPDLCDLFAKYNAGGKGSCRGRGGEYGKDVTRLIIKSEGEIRRHYALLDLIETRYDPDMETEENCDDQVQRHP